MKISFLSALGVYVAFLLAGVPVQAQQESQYALLSRPVFKNPLIWRLTKSVTNSLWGVDLFYCPWSMAQSYVISPSFQYLSVGAFLADHYWDRIVYLESLDDWIRAYGQSGAGAGKFSWPRAIDALAPSNETYYSVYYFIYIADTENNRIVKLKYNWQNQVMAYDGDITGSLDRPIDLDLNNSGDFWPGDNDYLWVLEHDSRISRYTRDGVCRATYSIVGCNGQPGELCGATAIVSGRSFFLSPPYDRYANNDDIYVADTGNHRIVRLRKSPNSEVLSWLGVVPTTAGVTDLEVDNMGQVWAVDPTNNRLTKYTSDLIPLCAFGNGDFVPNRFYAPRSVSNAGGYLGYGEMFVGEA